MTAENVTPMPRNATGVTPNNDVTEAEVVALFQQRKRIECSPYQRWKPYLDRPLAAVLLLLTAPIVSVLIVLVRLESAGAGIYPQRRVGKGGKFFTMYKIRTMRNDAESKSGVVWTTPGDPRITPLGRILRKCHLDELPQLLNVWRGQMSLVGPRPERPEFVIVLPETVPDYLDRLEVLPGVTGLAQINLLPDADAESVRSKLYLDRQYIQQATFWLDVRMMICTSLRLIGISGERATEWLRLKRAVPLNGHAQPVPAATQSSPEAPQDDVWADQSLQDTQEMNVLKTLTPAQAAAVRDPAASDAGAERADGDSSSALSVAELSPSDDQQMNPLRVAAASPPTSGNGRTASVPRNQPFEGDGHPCHSEAAVSRELRCTKPR